jgi:hypothetical protein
MTIPLIGFMPLPESMAKKTLFKETQQGCGTPIADMSLTNCVRVYVANISAAQWPNCLVKMTCHRQTDGTEVTSTNHEKRPHVFTQSAGNRNAATTEVRLGPVSPTGSVYFDFSFGLHALNTFVASYHEKIFLRFTLRFDAASEVYVDTRPFYNRARKASGDASGPEQTSTRVSRNTSVSAQALRRTNEELKRKIETLEDENKRLKGQIANTSGQI